MRIFMLRHGRTKWNLEHRVQTFSDGKDNTLIPGESVIYGMLGQFLAKYPIKAAYTSPFNRCIATTQSLNLSADIIHDQRLVDGNLGVFEGLQVDRAELDPGYNRRKIDRNYAVPQGESLNDVAERIAEFYKSIYKYVMAKDQDCVVVSHRSALRELFGQMYPNLDIDPEHGTVYVYDPLNIPSKRFSVACQVVNNI